MEKFNLNCRGVDNIIKTICWILSFAAWLFYLVIGWISLIHEDDFLWTLLKKNNFTFTKKNVYPYIPIQIDTNFIYILFIATLGISTSAFCVYLINSICMKNNSVFNGMMGKISRFHFIPLICAGALFIIGQSMKDIDIDIDLELEIILNRGKDGNQNKNLVITAMIFSIIGTITLMLVHTQTTIEPWYASLLIKKGMFSCLITMFTYSIFYTGLELGFFKKIEEFSNQGILRYLYDIKEKKRDKISKLVDNAAIALSISLGLTNIGLSIGLKDPIISLVNLLIYIGMVIYYYNVTDEFKSFISDKDNGDGPIDIVMMVLSTLAIIFLLIQNKTDTFK